MLEHIKIYYITLKNDSIKNRKKNLEATVEEMRNFAFVYIEKYAPSKQQLKTYLLKKYLKSGSANLNKKNVTDLIDVVLEDLEKTKFINDKFYSNSKAKSQSKEAVQLIKLEITYFLKVLKINI